MHTSSSDESELSYQQPKSASESSADEDESERGSHSGSDKQSAANEETSSEDEVVAKAATPMKTKKSVRTPPPACFSSCSATPLCVWPRTHTPARWHGAILGIPRIMAPEHLVRVAWHPCALTHVTMQEARPQRARASNAAKAVADAHAAASASAAKKPAPRTKGKPAP